MSANSARSARSRLVFPLDYASLSEAREGAARVSGAVGVLKVGLELFVREGPAAVQLAAELGCKVFLDLKLLDIPETVSRAVASACAKNPVCILVPCHRVVPKAGGIGAYRWGAQRKEKLLTREARNRRK